jgi:hypothetical protein
MVLKKILLLISVLLAFYSCEEEVVLDLDEAERRLVVEAILSNEYHALKVSLSYSQGFYTEPEYTRTGDATVVVADEFGNFEQLEINENGVFLSHNWVALPNSAYELNINTSENNISVKTMMPKKVEIMNVQFVASPFWGADSLNAFVEVLDPVNEDNYFRLFVRELGATKMVEYYLVDDSFGKNDVISMPVYYRNFAVGDTVLVELRHLTKDTYEFYSTLSENVNGSFNSIAPGNPVSNMPPDVMGHFVSYYVDTDTIVVPGVLDKMQ